MDGTKILSISVENLQFLDSLIFMAMNLKSMPKPFDLTFKKSYYPHLFNMAKNLVYVGPYSEPNYYGAVFMSVMSDPRFWHGIRSKTNEFSTIRKNC